MLFHPRGGSEYIGGDRLLPYLLERFDTIWNIALRGLG